MNSPQDAHTEGDASSEEKQCRICLDGPDDTLGRLIRPCLCRGSISFHAAHPQYVHVKCLQRWRNSSPSSSAFFACPQCHYRYHFARTKVVGVATNPVVIGGLSTVFFVLIVLASSFLTTTFLSAFEDPSLTSSDYYVFSPFWTNPIDVGHELVRAALRILQDDSVGILDPDTFGSRTHISPEVSAQVPRPPPGLLKRLVQRFILGLPVVGAGSLVHMLLSLPLLGPVHWIARFRGGRSRRSSGSGDAAAIVIVVLLVLGACRALYKVYQLTESLTKRILLRAEDIILEVN
ncbi:hypothetical protein EWM64_g10323 [Hericium alpestre]|uniref:RING-CH-type domain-containing protein n=1 Tax=Hericium alpestre TaxID=135208 RepID=A0A4Y9ZJT2_9AGAM|nr:hypothetical protein EWM64_g10323 [Hericium alpestre]